MIRMTLAAAAAVASLLCCAPGKSADEQSAAWIAEHYNDLERLTASPIVVDPRIAVACTTSKTPDPMDGPHAESAISIYVNESARKALDASSTFEPGSIVVKLKRRDSEHPRGSEAIGGMIKRGPGYDPSGGDWEFFYQENGKLESGRLSSCVACHASASHDHVFASWIDTTTLKRSEP